MVSPSLLRAAAASLQVQISRSVRATGGFVLMEQAEGEKTCRLKSTYREIIVPLLLQKFHYSNIQQVPKIEKVVVNCGIREADSKGLEAAMSDLALITGQRPVKLKSKNDAPMSKFREPQSLGIAVTLTGNMMYSFLDRLVNFGLPRAGDIHGASPNSFDGHGNYSLRISDQSLFPEIEFEAVGKPRELHVRVATTAKSDREAQGLLALIGMPVGEIGGTTIQPRKKKSKARHLDSKSKRRSKRR